DSPFQSLREVIEAVRENPGSVIVSSTGGISLGSVAYYLLQHLEDVEFSYVPFDGGADAVLALLGGHVDITLENPGTVRAHFEAGTIRPLAIAYEYRIPGFENTPTFREEGVDIVLSQVRGFIMPPGVPHYVVEFWENIFQQVFETPEFQYAYLLDNSLIPLFLNSGDYLIAFEEITAFFLEAFAMMGFDVVDW
ncbi:MAG: tripartite tricarboxylate transporter substrate-binding protein, partial [Oscillospiraceae bacterium]|nr:tripartite tricarboxylate transporter substrate-binding protein [Oscillospiraceae bacterium]